MLWVTSEKVLIGKMRQRGALISEYGVEHMLSKGQGENVLLETLQGDS